MTVNRKTPLLFKYYPRLESSIPWVKLAPLRTPVRAMDNLGDLIGVNSLWVKEDDKTSPIYGGNKVRKLEFVLADAIDQKCTTILTVGGIGSNHCVSTGFFCRELGLKGIVALIDQPITEYVKRNLLLEIFVGNEILYAHTSKKLNRKMRWKLLTSKNIYFVGPGGSSPLGVLGFVNAALELKEQIDNGQLPEPDVIFVACGSAGTVAGLTLGIKLADLKSHIYGIRVTRLFMSEIKFVKELAVSSWNLLVDKGINLPKIAFDHLTIDENYYGDAYGKPTPECLEAIKILKETEQIKLEPTYTGKAMAGLIDQVRKDEEKFKDKNILFWNTYNSRDFSDIVAKIDYRKLPKKLHWIFEKEN